MLQRRVAQAREPVYPVTSVYGVQSVRKTTSLAASLPRTDTLLFRGLIASRTKRRRFRADALPAYASVTGVAPGQVWRVLLEAGYKMELFVSDVGGTLTRIGFGMGRTGRLPSRRTCKIVREEPSTRIKKSYKQRYFLIALETLVEWGDMLLWLRFRHQSCHNLHAKPN